MHTQGEIEAAACDAMTRFEREVMGRGPKDIRAYLIGDMLLIRLSGVLSVAEQQLVNSSPEDKGRELVKRVRSQLIQTARPTLEALVHEVTGCNVVSFHHDISTVTGEKVIIFTLSEVPVTREKK